MSGTCGSTRSIPPLAVNALDSGGPNARFPRRRPPSTATLFSGVSMKRLALALAVVALGACQKADQPPAQQAPAAAAPAADTSHMMMADTAHHMMADTAKKMAAPAPAAKKPAAKKPAKKRA